MPIYFMRIAYPIVNFSRICNRSHTFLSYSGYNIEYTIDERIVDYATYQITHPYINVVTTWQPCL